MAHGPFSLHRRPAARGKPIYYVQFYDDLGERLPAVSTGQRTKAAAEEWAYRYLTEDRVGSKTSLTFGQYAERFFIWGQCPYIESQLARGNALSRNYADSLRSYLENHVLPEFKDIKLVKIAPRHIEEWLLGLREKTGKTGYKLSTATINQCLNALRIVLKEAARLRYIPSDPSAEIKQLKKNTRLRGVLTPEEVRKLFSPEALVDYWDGNHQHFTLNMLAASTGMRLGEIQALQIRNIEPGYIRIESSLARKYGLKEPKRNSKRIVTIPDRTEELLKEEIAKSPFSEPTDFVFYGVSRKVPVDGRMIDATLYRALSKMGIDEATRRERNLTFHSWRHFFNSFLRTKVADAKLQSLTGHKTMEMTDHYTHFSVDDYSDVKKIQAEIVGGADHGESLGVDTK